jgi:hypothetical protein
VQNSLSVVVQGKVFGLPGDPYKEQLTMQCIKSIRDFLPKAEIILSTWEGSVVSHLDYDKVVFNQDPGAVAYCDDMPNFFNNNNRQIVSTYNGLKAATKTYAIKMRGDCKLVDTDFIYYLKEYPRGERYSFFKQRVVTITKYSRNIRRIAQLIHPSDIFQVGLLEDLLDLWDIPLQPEPETTRAFPIEKKIINNSHVGGFHRMKLGAEQYNWYAFCKKHGLDLELKYFSNLPVNKILPSEISMINNLVIVEALKLGIVIPKRMEAHYDKDLYTHEEWLKLCEKYSVKRVTKFDEWALITLVYINNVLKILSRAQKKLFNNGIGGFATTVKKYISS